MIKIIRKWLEPPIFEGEEEKTIQARTANTLFIYLIAALSIAIVILIPLFAVQKIGSWILTGTIFCVLIAGRSLINKGQWQPGIRLIFSIIYLCILLLMILSGGSSSTAMLFFAIVVLVAGYYLEATLVNWFTIPIFLLAMGISLLQGQGLIAIPAVFQFNSLFSWLATGLGLIFMIKARDLFVQNLKETLADARVQNALLKKTQTSLNESELRYKNLFENNHAIMLIIDPDNTTIIDVNPTACTYYGWPRDEFLKKKISEINILTPEEIQLEVELARSEKRNHFFFKHRLANGTIRDVEIYSSPLILSGKIFLYSIIHDITDQKRAESAQRENQKQLTRILENLQDAYFQADITGKFTMVNPAAIKMYGYHSFEELIGMPAESLYANKNDRKSLFAMLQNSDRITDWTCLATRKDGTNFWVSMNVQFLKDEEGHVIGTEGVVRDISERRRVEDELRESQALTIAIMNSTPDLIWSVDPENFGLLSFNNSLKTYFKNSRDIEIEIGMRPEDLLPAGNFPDQWKDFYRRALREENFSVEYLTHTKIVTLLLTFNLLEQEGRVFGITVFGKDITLIKQTQEALIQREHRFHALFQNIETVAVQGYRMDGITQYWNDASEKVYGYSAEEAIGQNLLDLIIPPEMRDDVRQAVQQMVLTGEPMPASELSLMRKDGSRVSVYSSHVIVTNPGAPPELFCLDIDLTERKQAESAIAEAKLLYESIFRLSPEAILLTTAAEGRYLAVSDAHQRLTGYSAEEVIGHTVSEFSIWENMSFPHQEISQQLLTEGSVRNLVNRFHRKSGELFYAELSMARVEVGGEQCLVSILSDITERKRAEKFLKDIIAKNPLSIQVFDKEGFLLEANPAQKLLFGSVPPSGYSIFNDLQLAQKGMGEFFDKLRNGEEVLFPDVLFNAHDSVPEMPDVPVWVRTIGFPLCDDNEIPERFILMHENISERKLAEEAHRASEKKYRELFQVNKDGIAIYLLKQNGPPTAFVEVNNAAHRMLGYTREEMLQFTPIMLEPFTPQAHFRSRQAELVSKGILEFETVLLHKQGHPIFAEFTAQLIQYEGRPAVMNIVRDVNERKQREKEMRAIGTLSAALRTAPTLREMLPVIVEQMRNLLESDTISIELIDPLTQEAVVKAAYGSWASMVGFRQPKGSGVNAWIAETKLPYCHNNIKEETRKGFPAHLFEEIQSAAGIPLIAQDQLIGFLWMGRKKEISEFEIRLLIAVADIAANAIYRSTMYERSLQAAEELNQAYDTTLEGWAHALELRDQETEGHARHVVKLTIGLAKEIGIPEIEMDQIRRGALLHDIGKMGIPDSVLLKPGTLNEREWEIMRRHPEYAYDLLAPIEYLQPVLDIPYAHHEKWDGSGYPRGLKGLEIPLAARIFAIVDVWDALMSDRPYRKAWSYEQSYKYIQEQAGKHFDPKIVNVFLEMLDKHKQDH